MATKEYLLKEVFTPAKPARVSFVNREKINRRVVRALETPGTQIVVYGHTGSGKTTLLENKLFEVYEKHIRTNCMMGTTFEQVVLDAFEQLSEFYVDEVTNNKKTKVNKALKANYLSIKMSIGSDKEDAQGMKKKRILPPQLTPQSLGRLMGSAGYCWVLEDFHKVADGDKVKLSQLMKVFMDMSDEFEDLKVIALGAVNTAREVVQGDAEMRRRLSEINVPLMTENEIIAIITKGEEALGVCFGAEIKEKIAHYCNGLPAIAHKLAYLMCDGADIKATLPKRQRYDFLESDLNIAIDEYIEDESDTIKRVFDNALTHNKGENAIRALLQSDQHGANIDELFGYCKEANIRIQKNHLDSTLEELSQPKFGEVVKFDEDSYRYSFSDPFFRSFALAFVWAKDEANINKKLTPLQKQQIYQSALAKMNEVMAS
ncbi:TPA: ATP-binding protein [Vibrio parahaemolyticus]|nr:ATP-binding protein [Vibrio parahaemolyticus]EJG0907425.1 ATP-binding protein [Vibrio parahaemolyticus]EJG0909344.1 ATP-binding protein [Vibrio parahaemolyticus]HCG7145808.1 ATP-binding protein [Vibrio parahaemolyticus]HCG7147969.1 ATP-binding protein [Vibrio parahaemolyticus]